MPLPGTPDPDYLGHLGARSLRLRPDECLRPFPRPRAAVRAPLRPTAIYWHLRDGRMVINRRWLTYRRVLRRWSTWTRAQ